MKVSISFVFIFSLLFLSCKSNVAKKNETQTTVKTEVVNNDDGYKLKNSHTVYINKKSIKVLDKDAKLIEKNSRIIRLQDENGSCFSEGYVSTTSTEDGFMLSQQNCSRKYIINEYLSFTFNSTAKNYPLTGLKLEYRSKQDPDQEPEVMDFDKDDFGEVLLKYLNADSLIIALSNS